MRLWWFGRHRRIEAMLRAEIERQVETIDASFNDLHALIDEKYEVQKALDAAEANVRQLKRENALLADENADLSCKLSMPPGWHNKRRPTRPGYVYLLYDGTAYKIGMSRKVEQRVKDLENQYGRYLSIVHTIRTAHPSKAERFFHEKYDDHRLDGEWFSLTNAEVEHFCAYAVWRINSI